RGRRPEEDQILVGGRVEDAAHDRVVDELAQRVGATGQSVDFDDLQRLAGRLAVVVLVDADRALDAARGDEVHGARLRVGGDVAHERLDAERARAGAHAVDDDVVGTGRDVRHHGDLRRPRRRDVRARLPRAGLARLRDLDRRIEPADVLDLDDEIDGDERARHVDRVDAIVAGRLRAGGGEGVARGRAV